MLYSSYYRFNFFWELKGALLGEGEIKSVWVCSVMGVSEFLEL